MARNGRTAVHNEFVGFRMSAPLVAAAEARAGERGMSLSEFIRDVVRRDVLADR